MTAKYLTIRKNSVCFLRETIENLVLIGGFDWSDSQGVDLICHSCKTHGCCAESPFVSIRWTAVKVELTLAFL